MVPNQRAKSNTNIIQNFSYVEIRQKYYFVRFESTAHLIPCHFATNRHNLIFVNICNIFWLSKACHENVDKCRKVFLLILIKIYFEKKEAQFCLEVELRFKIFLKTHNARLIHTVVFRRPFLYMCSTNLSTRCVLWCGG